MSISLITFFVYLLRKRACEKLTWPRAQRVLYGRSARPRLTFSSENKTGADLILVFGVVKQSFSCKEVHLHLRLHNLYLRSCLWLHSAGTRQMSVDSFLHLYLPLRLLTAFCSDLCSSFCSDLSTKHGLYLCTQYPHLLCIQLVFHLSCFSFSYSITLVAFTARRGISILFPSRDPRRRQVFFLELTSLVSDTDGFSFTYRESGALLQAELDSEKSLSKHNISPVFELYFPCMRPSWSSDVQKVSSSISKSRRQKRQRWSRDTKLVRYAPLKQLFILQRVQLLFPTKPCRCLKNFNFIRSIAYYEGPEGFHAAS